MAHHNILLIGPLSGPVTGQMRAFLESVSAFENPIVLDSSMDSITSSFRYYLTLLKCLIGPINSVYFTGSRSKLGFLLRDLPLGLFYFKNNIKVINHIHGNDFSLFYSSCSFVLRYLVNIFYYRLNKIILPSSSLTFHFEKYGLSKIVILNNPLSEIFATPSDISKDNSRLNLLYLSNFIESKGFKISVDVAKRLVNRGYDVNLRLCGKIIPSDREAMRIRMYLDSLADLPFISVFEGVDDSLISELYGQASYFLLPTTYPTEAAPISILEALVSECYVITTNQGAIPTMLSGLYAAIVEPDPSVISDHIEHIYLAGGPDPFFLKRNSEFIRSRYSVDSYRLSVNNVISS